MRPAWAFFVSLELTKPKLTRRKLTDYKPDPANANQGSPIGQQMIQASLSEVGTGRSIVAAADDVLIAGSQTMKAAQAAGIKEVLEIETPGDVLLVHKRTDMKSTDVRARRAAYLDNRSQEKSLTWDIDQIEADIEAGVDMDGIFRQDELDEMFADADLDRMIEEALDTEVEEKRLNHDADQQVTVVLYTKEVSIFEQAIRKTGNINRGEALIAICKAYLGDIDAV